MYANGRSWPGSLIVYFFISCNLLALLGNQCTIYTTIEAIVRVQTEMQTYSFRIYSTICIALYSSRIRSMAISVIKTTHILNIAVSYRLKPAAYG
jgi:hypothetical protein